MRNKLDKGDSPVDHTLLDSTSETFSQEIQSTKFIDLDHPGVKKWRSFLESNVANDTIYALSFSPNIKKQVKKMADEVFYELNSLDGFEDVRIDFSSQKYPDVQPDYISTIGFRGDVSDLIIAQVSDLFGIQETSREMDSTVI